ncbi:MAG: cytosolic protein [Desulfatitalea sp. BRH_c12]|nr:MAG: cytosolic protein [Desulfatitalea sp. BRH_c12]
MSVSQPKDRIDDLSKDELLKVLPDFMHRIVIHYALWFTEVRHQMGMPKALEMLSAVFEKNMGLQMKRLGKTLGFEVVDGLPAALTNLDKTALLNLIDEVAKNWLANDGLWFQAVEFSHGMNDAKRCNDSCWAHFSPFEAWSVKRLLGLGEAPGLQGLARALNFRVYARLNTQSVSFEEDNALVFKMNVCRVQAARKAKGLVDYPCKSAGLVEYTYFARGIDARIVTECIGCPPDAHPEDWFCAWRFKI